MLFVSSADFFQNQVFRKILSGIPSMCQIVWIQIRDLSSADFFFKTNFLKSSFRNTINVSNSLDPDRGFVVCCFFLILSGIPSMCQTV